MATSPGRRSADDPLDDDPDPGDEPEGPERDPGEPAWRGGGAGQVRCRRLEVAGQHDDERQGDGHRGAGDIHRQRQAARVGRVQGVGEDGGRQERGQGRRGRPASRGAPAAAAPDDPPSRGGRGGVSPAEQEHGQAADQQGAEHDRQEDVAGSTGARRVVRTARRGRRRGSGRGCRSRRRHGARGRRRRRGGRGGGRRCRGGGGLRRRRDDDREPDRAALDVAVVGDRGPLDLVLAFPERRRPASASSCRHRHHRSRRRSPRAVAQLRAALADEGLGEGQDDRVRERPVDRVPRPRASSVSSSAWPRTVDGRRRRPISRPAAMAARARRAWRRRVDVHAVESTESRRRHADGRTARAVRAVRLDPGGSGPGIEP